MPGFNGSGPRGRGQGNCGSNSASPQSFGRGRGFGRGIRRGFGFNLGEKRRGFVRNDSLSKEETLNPNYACPTAGRRAIA